jgi:N utilization substance protein B
MSQRSRARQVAFQVLYQDDMNPQSAPAVGELLITRRLRSAEAMEFARSLISGVRQNRGELDPLLETIAEHWALKRMAATDRNILRLGAYELLHTETPPRVAIDEAVELAKRFGSAHSAPFVNGILDRVMHGKEGMMNTE